MRATKRQTEAIRDYVESQAHEEVVHLEKTAPALVGPARHDIWDVHCTDSSWRMITESTNLYIQVDFKSRGVALTFHIGLVIRDLPTQKTTRSLERGGLPRGRLGRWPEPD